LPVAVVPAHTTPYAVVKVASPVPPCPTVTAAAVPNRVPDVGRVTFVAAVDVRVMENAPAVASVEPVISDNVADVVGAVIVTLLIVVAVATPKVGVVKDGEVSGA
jgi:hypothetical protein